MSADQTDVLTVAGWTVLLRGRTLLQDIDLAVQARSCFVVLGDSGSGKSMLLRMLSGSMAHYPGVTQSGSVSYMGQSISAEHAPPMVSMSAGLLLAKVFDAVLERVRFQENLTRQGWTDWLESRLRRWGFPDLLDLLSSTVVSLSPLHQRVVAIAREALASPPLLLIDELTRELDEYDRFVLLDFVRELSSEMAVVVALSNPREARVLRGRMVYLSQGQTIASGDVIDFLEGEQDRDESLFDTPVPPDLLSSAAASSIMPAEGVSQLQSGAVSENATEPAGWDGMTPLIHEPTDAIEVPGETIGPLHLTEHVPSSFGPRGFYWILPGKLAGMPLPGLLNGLDHDLSALHRCRVTTLVSLSQQPVNAQALAHHKLEAVNLPGGNKEIPSLAQLKMMVRAIDRVLKQGGTVAVHCVSGNTRTGMVLAAYLIHQGAEVMAAIDQVKAANSLFNLLDEHIERLQALHASARQAVNGAQTGADKLAGPPGSNRMVA